jgi:hypothetical protein
MARHQVDLDQQTAIINYITFSRWVAAVRRLKPPKMRVAALEAVAVAAAVAAAPAAAAVALPPHN